ncbi:glycosyltransferase family 4 protein [Caenimonas sedimenti]|uniref:Glycosyltransferase family 4 protein n=1 Tax=Caenimonas sedimenti TaxID=2596921 RepID=A0A562ZG71_9BURK|nr:glycosyltransferase family 4 protein [Caenimonas sedimenti]TWO66146.1 glycosyltransferase family 4 protein [Caenimonas sedimenti]
MRAWIVTSGEPLPSDAGGGARLLRHGMVAAMMVARGWQVVWWTANFDHTEKRMRHAGPLPASLDLAPGYRLVLLPSRGYTRNVSLARIADHRELAAAFGLAAEQEAPPDVVLCSFPPIELAAAATCYGQRHGVPVVVDVRDLWPDIFLDVVPGALRWLGQLLLQPYARQARRALRGATAVTGITEPIVEWGCAKAGRPRAPLDRAFPLACPEPQPADAPGVQAATTRWTQRGVGTGRFVVCFFGAMGAQFDFETVLRAAALLERECPQALIVLCGQGHGLARLQAHASHHPNLLAPGWLGRDDLHSLMRLSAAGLAPYFNEHSFTLSVPNKVIEYLSGGLPVVASLQGQTQELLAAHECGLTYLEHDPQSLAACLRRLFDDGALRARLGANARRLFQQRFTAERVYGAMIDHLVAVAAPVGGARA